MIKNCNFCASNFLSVNNSSKFCSNECFVKNRKKRNKHHYHLRTLKTAIIPNIKRCYKCKLKKKFTEFHKNRGNRDGLVSICKSCKSEYVRRPEVKSVALMRQRERYKNPKIKETNRIKSEQFRKSENGKKYIFNHYLKYNYGIDSQKYMEMFESQSGCCAICKRHQSHFKKRLALDHNHKTGAIRELLCKPCNTSLGNVEEDINRILAMIKYLKKHNSKEHDFIMIKKQNLKKSNSLQGGVLSLASRCQETIL